CAWLPRLVARRCSAGCGRRAACARGEPAPGHSARSKAKLMLPESGSRGGHEVQRAHHDGSSHRTRTLRSRRMKIALMYDDVSARPNATADDLSILESLNAVDDAICELGYTPIWIPVPPRIDAWIELLTNSSIDVVFNLCE